MRLIITGKTRSGKSTAVHRILAHILQQKWAGVILFDGKGNELKDYASVAGVTFLNPHNIETWADTLEQHASGLMNRYDKLAARGLRAAAPEDPRYLIVLDEVQQGTRAPKLGKRIRDAVGLIFEQSGALGDVIIVTSQREPNAIPPTARENANAHLRMLGNGYFFYQADGVTTARGRVSYITPAESLSIITDNKSAAFDTAFITSPPSINNLPEILGSHHISPTKAPATFYFGAPGAGKTHALLHHSNGSTNRHLYIDLAQPHRAAIVTLIENAGAVVPPKARIPELVEIASLALRSEKTLLLIDNVDRASPKALDSIPTLMSAAEAVALAANAPGTPPERRKLEPLLPRCEVEELKPLPPAVARELLWSNLDKEAIQNTGATERRILSEASGNPKTIISLAHRVKRGDVRELRSFYTPTPRINLSWLFLVVIISFAMIARWQVDSYLVAGILFAVSLVLRPLLYRSMHSDR